MSTSTCNLKNRGWESGLGYVILPGGGGGVLISTEGENKNTKKEMTKYVNEPKCNMVLILCSYFGSLLYQVLSPLHCTVT